MRNRSAIFRHAADEWKAMRAEFELVLESVYARMERDTNGVLLNADGKREPITAWSLMTGPAWRVERYGSPELREWVRIHGRPSIERFEAEWFANRYAAQVELGPDSGGNGDRIRELVASAAKLDTVRPGTITIPLTASWPV